MQSAPKQSEMRSESATKVLHCWNNRSYAPGADAIWRYWTTSGALTGCVMGVIMGEGPLSGCTPVPAMVMTAPGIHLKATSPKYQNPHAREFGGAGLESMWRL